MMRINLFFNGVRQGFKDFAYSLTNTINLVLLLVVYIFGIGLVSIVSKLFRKHFLDLKKQNDKSNWKDHKITKQPLEKYYRTF